MPNTAEAFFSSSLASAAYASTVLAQQVRLRDRQLEQRMDLHG